MYAPQAPPETESAPTRPEGTIAADRSAAPGLLSRAEPLICRLLRVDGDGSCPAPRPTRRDDEVTHRLFNVSIGLSAIRCLLSYVVFPIVVPAIGGAASVPPAAGLPIGVVALVFDVIAVRRFWVSRHRWRWPVTGIYALVMGLVVALLVGDVVHLAG